MAKLINREGVLNLARSLVEANPDSLRDPDGYLSHVVDSYDVAGEVLADTVNISRPKKAYCS